jgi:predicted patatin/cPLA2 family phospholipase
MEGSKMKKGLVLEGGGIRGIFSAGVMDVLMEEGIEFDGAIGVSAGAAFGCNYKSRQPRRAIRYNLKYAKDPRYSSVRSLLKTGDLFNAQFCYHDIPEKLYPFDWKAFRENPMQFFLVCTDVETGKPVYHLCDNDSDWQMLEWFRASGSMPLVSRVVEIGSQKLLDGGISDSIPLRFMENKGYDRNVVILTRPAGYVKEPAPMMRVISRVLQQYPEAVKAMENRHNVYNETLAYIRQREAGKFAFVIRPEEDLDVGRIEHDRFKIREAYKAGRRAARKRLNALRRFLDAADNEVFADGTYSTNASIIANAPGAETLPSDDFLTDEEKTAAEAAPAGEEKAAEKAPSYVGTIEEAIPAPAEEKKDEKDASSFRAQVFGEAIDEQAGFEKPVSFVDRQEAALRRERESAMEAEEAAEKAEAERIAAEKAEAERIAAEKAEAERIAAEKAEAERIAAEKAEAERIAAEKAEAARIAAEKRAAEKAEAERIAAEKRAAARKAREDMIAAEKAAAEKAAEEKAAAMKAAMERAAAAKASAVTGAKDIAENISEANSPLMLRGRRQKKTWKPGNMTHLKQKEDGED